MDDRLAKLVGAGAIAAGMAGALLAGAGVAAATTESETGNASTSSESAQPESGEPGDSDDTAESPAADDAEPEVDATDEDAAEEADPEEEQGAEDEGAQDRGAEEAQGPEEEEAVVEEGPDEDEAFVVEETPEADVDTATELPAEVEPQAVTPVQDEARTETTATAPLKSHQTELATMLEQPGRELATAPRKQTLLSVVGTVIFTIYSAAIRVLGGPPLLPWGSTVTVRSSSLRIDCGDGYDVPADWYVPAGDVPTRLIYLQHGFLASGAFYSYTAARLAEATHSIVVATSVTSNFLACDGCWVGGSPLHKAVAGLFVDGNAALAQSALAAGYGGTLLDGVQKVALVGHSAGGGLAAGAAGYMTQNGAFDRLAGVVLLDGVGFGDVTPAALAKLPQDFPIYNLAGRSYYWNLSGTSNTSLEQWRPGKFNGVQLVGGSHSDTMLGGNPLIQAALNIVTGWSKVANVKAAEKISAGWLNDMFAGAPPSESGFYGAPGDTLTVATSRGTATAIVLPGPAERQTFIDWLFTFGARLLFGINFATCAVEPDEVFTENSTNTASSLDATAKPGQSIAQQCVHG